MFSSRREYNLSKDQPILERARRRSRKTVKSRSEADFWLMFDLEKFARDWQGDMQRQRLATAA